MSTDFYAGQPYNKDAWGHKAYDEYTEQFYFTGMLGTGESAIIDHITELTKNNKGESGAWMHLVADIHGGGVVGDNTMEGRERDLEASWLRAQFDQIRNGMVTKGRVSEQKSVINTRKQFRKKMARWLAESYEDQAILTASGVSYAFNTDGSPRVTPAGQDAWTDLAYAADVSAPTSGRYAQWDATNGLVVGGSNTNLAVADVATYDIIPELEALARRTRFTPLRANGEEFFVWLIHTNVMAKLWRDANFRSIVVNGEVRGGNNPIFKGSKVTMNNIIIKPYVRSYTTLGAATGSKWGGGAVDGNRTLLMGTQALGMVDLGAVGWEEDQRDFKNRWALAVDKMGGFTKPKFKDSRSGTVEDFGIFAIDVAL